MPLPLSSPGSPASKSQCQTCKNLFTASRTAPRRRLRAPGPVAFTGLVIALGSECCAVSPADPRFNHDFVDEALADLLSSDEKCHVSVHQVSSTIEGDLLIVTIVDATGPGAVSSNILSQTLMLQALNPDSPLRQRCLGTPLRVVPPGSVVQFEQETKLSERDIAGITAGSKLLQGQQLLVDNIGKSKDEVKALAERAAEAKKKLASAQEEAAEAEAALVQAASGDKHEDGAPRQQRGFISGGEIKALESVFDLHFDPERRSYNMDEARTQSKFVLEESQLRLKELEIESKVVFEESQLRLKELKSLEDLRTLTLRQTDERNAMIAKLEEDLVHIFVVRSMQCVPVLSSLTCGIPTLSSNRTREETHQRCMTALPIIVTTGITLWKEEPTSRAIFRTGCLGQNLCNPPIIHSRASRGCHDLRPPMPRRPFRSLSR